MFALCNKYFTVLAVWNYSRRQINGLESALTRFLLWPQRYARTDYQYMTSTSRFTEITVQGKASKPHKARISRKVKAAVEAMVFDAKDRREAAKEQGILDETMRQALKRPNVAAYKNDCLRVLRESAAARSVARIDRLADHSSSDHVKLSASQWLAGLEGIAPVNRSEIDVTHRAVTPGYVINLSPEEPGQISNQSDKSEKTSDNKAIDAEFSMVEDENE